jgi:hypothetical protein
MTDEQYPFPIFRTQEQANALLPEAREVVSAVISRLPPGLFDINLGTLFVGLSVPEEVACFAAGLVGMRYQLAAVEFELRQPFDETVDNLVSRLLQWRASAESGEDA